VLALLHCDERTSGRPHLKSRDALPVQVVTVLKSAVDLGDSLDVCDEGKRNKRVSRVVGRDLIGIPLSFGCRYRLNSDDYDSCLTRLDDFIEIKVGALASGRRRWSASHGQQLVQRSCRSGVTGKTELRNGRLTASKRYAWSAFEMGCHPDVPITCRVFSLGCRVA